MAKIVYRVVSPAKLTAFLRKFSSVENTLLVEIQGGEIKAKTHTADRSVVKSSKAPMDEILKVIEGDENVNVIIGLYNIEKFASSFKHFGSSDVDMVIDYDKLDKNNIGTNITLRSEKLNIRFDCASYRLFNHISDEMMNQIAGDVSNGVTFDIDKNMQSQISSLCSIDTDHKLITIKTEDNKVKAIGKSFDLELVESGKSLDQAEITFYKQHFNNLDREDALVVIADDKIVFRSSETNTVLVVGRTEE